MTAGPTFVVQLTPPGRGAIATCVVSGARATALADRLVALLSGNPVSGLRPGQIALGRWRGSQAEELVVARRAENRVELHCHGGHAAVAVLVDDLQAAGAQAVAWQEWIAGHGGTPLREPPLEGTRPFDALSAEATIALADARTERVAAILLDQYHGALAAELRAIQASLGRGDAVDAAAGIERLLGRAALGLRLRDPWHVVLHGEPNVGKSSLINALVGYSRAIVHPEPGTTRDVVSATTAVDGWPVTLYDTAGVRAAAAGIEAAGVDAARRQITAADLTLLVLDRAAPFGDVQQALVDSAAGAMIVHNKSDLPADPSPRPAGIDVSALTGEGIVVLLRAIADRLVPKPPLAGGGVPFHPRHVAALEAAREALGRGDVAIAAAAVEQLVGE